VKIVGFSTTGEELGEQTLAETGSMRILSKRDGPEVRPPGWLCCPRRP
jgi:hypothetical protein